jgi:hypothetical protein
LHERYGGASFNEVDRPPVPFDLGDQDRHRLPSFKNADVDLRRAFVFFPGSLTLCFTTYRGCGQYIRKRSTTAFSYSVGVMSSPSLAA